MNALRTFWTNCCNYVKREVCGFVMWCFWLQHRDVPGVKVECLRMVDVETGTQTLSWFPGGDTLITKTGYLSTSFISLYGEPFGRLHADELVRTELCIRKRCGARVRGLIRKDAERVEIPHTFRIPSSKSDTDPCVAYVGGRKRGDPEGAHAKTGCYKLVTDYIGPDGTLLVPPPEGWATPPIKHNLTQLGYEDGKLVIISRDETVYSYGCNRNLLYPNLHTCAGTIDSLGLDEDDFPVGSRFSEFA